MFLDYSLAMKSINSNGFFEGYASIFNVVDNMEDVILPGAFSKNLELDKIKLLWQHNAKLPIGKITHLTEDSNGLYVKAQLILAIQQAQEAYSLLKEGVINGLSIGYIPLSYSTDPHTGIRTIAEVDLWEISLVTFPANKFATITSYKSLFSAINKAHSSLQRLIGT